jgi:hypothetical protein
MRDDQKDESIALQGTLFTILIGNIEFSLFPSEKKPTSVAEKLSESPSETLQIAGSGHASLIS